MKNSDAKPKSGMHFEQIPLEVVKKIAGQEGSKETAEIDNLTIERVPVKTEPYSMPVLWLRKGERVL
jgi:hypothetical protein